MIGQHVEVREQRIVLVDRIGQTMHTWRNPCRERRSYFAVYFTAGFNNKTVPCTMNELYLPGQRVRLRALTAQ